MTARYAVICIAHLIFFSGCTEDIRRVTIIQDSGYTEDASESDASVEDANVEDASTDEDASEEDASVSFSCTFDTTTVLEDAEISTYMDLSLAVGLNNSVIVWSEKRDSVEKIFARTLSSELTLGTEAELSSVESSGLRRHPTVISQTDSFLAAWTDSSLDHDGYNIATALLDDAGSIVSETNIHNLTSDNQGTDTSPWLLKNSTGAAVAFIHTPAGESAHASLLLVDEDGIASGSEISLSSIATIQTRPVLSSLSTNAILGWLTNSSGIDLIIFDPETVESEDSPLEVTDSDVIGQFDIAGHDSGAGIVWEANAGSARKEIRFRSINTNGAFISVQRTLTTSPTQGSTPSITPFAGGYVVLYRSKLDSTSNLMATLLFVSAEGDVLGSQELESVESISGRMTLRIASDGLMYAAWVDSPASTATIRAAVIDCF